MSTIADEFAMLSGMSTDFLPLMSPDEVAEYLNISIDTIYAWRYRLSGPPCMKVGRHLRFHKAEVDAWLAKQYGPSGQE